MTTLTVYNENAERQLISQSSDFDQIKSTLAEAGITLRRWDAQQALSAQASNDEILSAYDSEIKALVKEGGYQSWDVVSMTPEHPQKQAFREKFLDEHQHSEDEVRFFVRGSGLFVLHIEGKVYALLCEQNDLINVPAGTKHWFDMGPNPSFTAIRLFNNPEGWVANFTGNDIASHYPKLDN